MKAQEGLSVESKTPKPSISSSGCADTTAIGMFVSKQLLRRSEFVNNLLVCLPPHPQCCRAGAEYDLPRGVVRRGVAA